MENEKLYNESIILIGPSGTGKSSVADRLEKITSMKRRCVDTIVDKDRESNFISKNFDNNMEKYNLYMIKREVEKAKNIGIPGIVDFGGGQTVYDNPEIFSEVKKQLAPFKNIILLLPSIDIEKSLQILASRSKGDYSQNRKFITSPCNRELATMIIYENGRNPSEIAEEIIIKINSKNKDNREER